MKVVKGKEQSEEFKEKEAAALNERKLDKIIEDVLCDSPTDRRFYVVTGTKGAMEAEIGFRIGAFEYSGGVVTDKVIARITSTVKSLKWKEGAWGLSTEGIKYLG